MPRYAYIAVTTSGSETKGSMDAASRNELVNRLREMGYFATHVEEAAGEEETGLFSGFRFGKKIKPKQVEFFTFQLATLVKAGIPLDRALVTCSEQAESNELRRLIEDIRADVEQGASLSEALAKHPKHFNDLYTNMVRSGQEGGVLGLVLGRLSEFSRQQRELRDSVVSALIYPIILLFIAVIIVAVMMLLVIPRFTTMFLEAGIDLPPSTRILIAAVAYVKSIWGFVWMSGSIPLPGATLAGMVIMWIAARQYGKTETGEAFFDKARMRVPLIGPVVRNFAIVRMTQTMSTLLENGVMLLTALRVGKSTTGSVVYESALEHAEQEVQTGSSLSGPLEESGLFPPIVTNMLAIGEESGRPEVMLSHLADYYDMEIKRSLERLVAALGPMLILFMAGIVVMIAVAIITPMVNISNITAS